MKYRVLIEQDEDGMFVVQVPSLPGCISQGATRTEALRNIKEAVALYLESLRTHNEQNLESLRTHNEPIPLLVY